MARFAWLCLLLAAGLAFFAAEAGAASPDGRSLDRAVRVLRQFRAEPLRAKQGEPILRDRLTSEDWPKFLHPFPLSEHYMLVSSKVSPQADWCVYLVDTFGNMTLIHQQPGYSLLEPIPLRATPRPPAVSDRVDLSREDGVVYLQDIYRGPGLAGVPRGTVKSLRVLAYRFGYRGLTGFDKIGIDGPWDVMRILGTVPIAADGSAAFRVPANTPISVQPLDQRHRALQLMRSWFTVMPGETRSCVGCHESQNRAPQLGQPLAMTRQPVEITPWYGPARGFDFEREVQPVLDKYCVSCHDGSPDEWPQTRVRIRRPFWIGDREVTNEQFHRFDPSHDSRFVRAQKMNVHSRGYPLNEPRQPVVRVTWNQAQAFCEWLASQTGEPFALPTEAQWEYACRAGSRFPMNWGWFTENFAERANMADRTIRNFSTWDFSPLNQIYDGWMPLVESVDDGAMVTAEVGSYAPNPWRLYDMHGNAAEWTLSLYRPYPYDLRDGREDPAAEGERAVRGGSWCDLPYYCTASYRFGYPPWRKVHNVGFRVALPADARKIRAVAQSATEGARP